MHLHPICTRTVHFPFGTPTRPLGSEKHDSRAPTRLVGNLGFLLSTAREDDENDRLLLPSHEHGMASSTFPLNTAQLFAGSEICGTW